MKQLDDAKFEYSAIGEPLKIGERTIRAVARVSGLKFALPGNCGQGMPDESEGPDADRQGRGSAKRRTGGSGSGAMALAKVTPVEFIVRDSDGEPYSVTVRDPESEAIRGIAGAAFAVAIIAIVVSILAGIARRDN